MESAPLGPGLGTSQHTVFRYDPSHRLHTGIDKIKLTKNLAMLLLAVLLALTGILLVVHAAIPDIGVILAILAIAAGIPVVLDREGETKNKSQHIP
ncbi:MAG: hypothetical protein M1570_05035 [Chloroflexi bacterium]|nr:hypothetical protein [Chloroflexota bacterium]